MCGHSSGLTLENAEFVAMSPQISDGSMDLGNTYTLPYVTAICNHCGFMSNYAVSFLLR